MFRRRSLVHKGQFNVYKTQHKLILLHFNTASAQKLGLLCFPRWFRTSLRHIFLRIVALLSLMGRTVDEGILLSWYIPNSPVVHWRNSNFPLRDVVEDISMAKECNAEYGAAGRARGWRDWTRESPSHLVGGLCWPCCDACLNVLMGLVDSFVEYYLTMCKTLLLGVLNRSEGGSLVRFLVFSGEADNIPKRDRDLAVPKFET